MSRDREYTTANLVSDSEGYDFVLEGLDEIMDKETALAKLGRLAVRLHPPTESNFFQGNDFPRNVTRWEDTELLGIMSIEHLDVRHKYTLRLTKTGVNLLNDSSI